MTGRGFISVLLLAVVYSHSATTTPSATTTEETGCYTCSPCNRVYSKESLTRHVQNHFCESAAVIQGKVIKKTKRREEVGIWNTQEHLDAVLNPYRSNPGHLELTVRVIAVHYNQTKVELDEEIIVRYGGDPGNCKTCGTEFENFADTHYPPDELTILKDQKYIFFLPVLTEAFGEKQESVMAQCTKVWRWSRKDKEVAPGYIPPRYRHLLSKTQCDKCRVSGCYQKDCVKAGEEQECNIEKLYKTWEKNVCQPLLDHGFCKYNSKTDTCRWIGISKDGTKSRKPIKQCLVGE